MGLKVGFMKLLTDDNVGPIVEHQQASVSRAAGNERGSQFRRRPRWSSCQESQSHTAEEEEETGSSRTSKVSRFSFCSAPVDAEVVTDCSICSFHLSTGQYRRTPCFSATLRPQSKAKIPTRPLARFPKSWLPCGTLWTPNQKT
jgi:hypothetical protein